METTTRRSTLDPAKYGNDTAGVMDAVRIGVKNIQTKIRNIKTKPVLRIAWEEAMITASDMDRD